jgi:hypothetical protein
MANESLPPEIPWWVTWWTDPTMTRSSLRQQAWLFFVMAAVFVAISAVHVFWRPSWWTGEIVLPVAAGLFPLAFTGGGVWILLASRWIDRHHVWDRITDKQEQKAYEENYSFSMRMGLLLLAVGGVLGALIGWMWETEVGIVLGIAVGAVVGFVLGSFFAGLWEGIRSANEKSTEVKSQYAEKSVPVDGGRDSGSS